MSDPLEEEEEEKAEEEPANVLKVSFQDDVAAAVGPFSHAMDEDVEEYSLEREQEELEKDETIQRALRYIETVTTWVISTTKNCTASTQALTVSNILQEMKGLYTRQKTSKVEKEVKQSDTMHKMINALRGLGVCLRDIHDMEVGDELASLRKTQYIVEQVARIPRLIPTILLLKNEVLKREILSLPMVTRAVMSKYSILTQDSPATDLAGQSDASSAQSPSWWTMNTSGHRGSRCWLMQMLKDPETKHVGVEYLEMISFLRITDYLRVPVHDNESNYQVRYITPTKESANAFNQERLELFQAVAQNDKLILRLFTLSNQDMERVGVTSAVQLALKQGIQRPFMMTLLFSDFLFHMVLLIIYRNKMFRTHRSVSFNNDFLSSIVLGCIVYFWFRFVVELALAKVSWHVFWKSVTYPWTLLELISTIMVTASWVFLDGFGDRFTPQPAYFAYQAFTIGVMWLKVLGFLQIMNRTLAAYINSMFEVLVAMGWFVIIMLVVIMAFGDMFYTIYTAFRRPDSNGESVCDSNESAFCDGSRTQSYLTIYRMFVGDFGYDDFDIDALTTTLYVAVTFVGVIVLLNMLIAIVTTSYEESRVRSDRQFARARIALVAKSLALEQLMMPRKDTSCSNRWLSIAIRILTSVILLYLSFLGGSVFFALSFGILSLATVPSDISSPISTCITSFVTLYLFFILAVYLWFGWEGQKTSCIYRFVVRRGFFNFCVYKPVRFLTLVILGTRPWKNQELQDQFEDDGWANHSDYTNKGTLAMFDGANTDNEKASTGDLERRLVQLETDLLADQSVIEKQASDLEAKHQTEIENAKKRAAEQEEKYLAALEDRDAKNKAMLEERDAMLAQRDEKHEANLRAMESRLLEALRKSKTTAP